MVVGEGGRSTGVLLYVILIPPHYRFDGWEAPEALNKGAEGYYKTRLLQTLMVLAKFLFKVEHTDSKCDFLKNHKSIG